MIKNLAAQKLRELKEYSYLGHKNWNKIQSLKSKALEKHKS